MLHRAEELRELEGPLYATLGTFDGVHRGHRTVLTELISLAESRHAWAVAVTFHPHPQQVVHPEDAPPLLSTWEEKVWELGKLGLHAVLRLTFDQKLARMGGEDFLRELMAYHPQPAGLVVGHDCRLGRGRELGADGLSGLATREGWELRVIEPQLVGGERVSSTRVRRLLLAGQPGRVRELLGRPYSLAAQVVGGAGRGRGLGFPTANLGALAERKLLPGDGVYACWVEREREAFPGALSIGPRASFGGGKRVMEVHLLDFTGELTGETLRVHLIERLRSQKRFDSADELREALAEDCRRALERLGSPEQAGSRAGFFVAPEREGC